MGGRFEIRQDLPVEDNRGRIGIGNVIQKGKPHVFHGTPMRLEYARGSLNRVYDFTGNRSELWFR